MLQGPDRKEKTRQIISAIVDGAFGEVIDNRKQNSATWFEAGRRWVEV